MHFRVPIDDDHTRIIWVGLRPSAEGGSEPPTFEYLADKPFNYGSEELQTFYGQDRIVWETQGAIFDRTRETLGDSDRGIVMFRDMLAEQIGRVERGEDPTVAVVRDPERNKIIIFESATRPTFDNEAHVLVSS
jgi:5,5'-dehydrodivanillate O-demethylase